MIDRWGWTSYNNSENLESQNIGRIVKESRHIYEIETSDGRYQAEISGHFHYTALSRVDYPTIGDWVVFRREYDKAIIERLLPRKSSFSRKRAGNEVEEQVVAANFDYLFVVFALEGGRNWSQNAVERFMTRAWDSGATPIIILNKCDLTDDTEGFKQLTEDAAPGVEVFTTSALEGYGIEEIKSYITEGKTIAFTGYSGVGKSALINAVCGVNLMRTGEIREDDKKGKHTTTHKEIVRLDSGALLIDSPGLKELQLWGEEDSLDSSFEDIAELALMCRFKDCNHNGEPGCAVQEAIESGDLEERRYENYLKMKSELRFLERKTSVKLQQEEKEKWKKISKFARQLHK